MTNTLHPFFHSTSIHISYSHLNIDNIFHEIKQKQCIFRKVVWFIIFWFLVTLQILFKMIVYLILAVLGELSILLHSTHPNWSLESVHVLQVSSPFISFIFYSKYNYHLTKSCLIIRKLLPQRYQPLLLYSLLSLFLL